MSELNFVAEVGVNHEASVKNAEQHIIAAATNGATAVKFQAYSADKIASINSPSYWDTEKESETSQHKLFSKYDKFKLEDYAYLSNVCRETSVDFMVTCFDLDWLEVLNPLVSTHKIASADITNLRLLDAVARTKKKVLLSTGASTIQEVETAINLLKFKGASDVVLMHCVLCYPTKESDANLLRMTLLREVSDKHGFNEIGYSDHTVPSPNHEVLMASIALGATWIEKHFSLTPGVGGNDHYHSFGPEQLSDFTARASRLNSALFFNEANFISIQIPARKNARRGLYAALDILEGTVLTDEHVIELRPVGEIPSQDISMVLGRCTNALLAKGDPISYDSLE